MRLEVSYLLGKLGLTYGKHRGKRKVILKRHAPMPSETIVEVFSFLTRIELDSLQLVNRQFKSIIANASSNQWPSRFMHAVLVMEDESVIVHITKGSNKQKLFPTIQDVLLAKKQQPTIFKHICIHKTNKTNAELSAQYRNLSRSDDENIPYWFAAYKNVPYLPPEFQHVSKAHSFYISRYYPDRFLSRIIEIRWANNISSDNNLTADHIVKWLESDNIGSYSSIEPKRFKANVFGMRDSPKAFMDIMFQRFQGQNKPCQFEIVIDSLENILDSAQLPTHKSVRNYETNEILESILMPANEEEHNNPDYVGIAWVLRRRSALKQWSSWWSVEENEKTLCSWIRTYKISDGTDLFYSRYQPQSDT